VGRNIGDHLSPSHPGRLQSDLVLLTVSKQINFCRVIDGSDTLDELEKLPVNPKNYKPLTDTRINSITIHANPLAG
jgi:hypothetical protein